MRVTRLELRDFRNYEAAELELPTGLAVVVGPNGAGKTNLLEAVYFGCTGASPRTANERELVRRGAEVARVVIETRDDEAEHRLEAGFRPGEAKHLRVDGHAVTSLATLEVRPLVSVFMPERLDLVKGGPSGRRAHIDQVVAALWPARAGTRRAYSRALAQRNALLARIRARAASTEALDAWDAELAREGIALMQDRAEAVDGLLEPFARLAGRKNGLGKAGETDGTVFRRGFAVGGRARLRKSHLSGDAHRSAGRADPVPALGDPQGNAPLHQRMARNGPQLRRLRQPHRTLR